MLEGEAGVKLDFVFATREILKEHVLSSRTVCLVVVFMLNLFPDAINESNPRVIDDSRARKRGKKAETGRRAAASRHVRAAPAVRLACHWPCGHA